MHLCLKTVPVVDRAAPARPVPDLCEWHRLHLLLPLARLPLQRPARRALAHAQMQVGPAVPKVELQGRQPRL